MEMPMSPEMSVEIKIVDKKPHYILILSQDNFNHLAANCPDIDRLFGYSESGLSFYLYPGQARPESFKQTPDGEGYFAYVGADVPVLPDNFSAKDLDSCTKQANDNLEKILTSMTDVPIEFETKRGTLILGYVTVELKK